MCNGRDEAPCVPGMGLRIARSSGARCNEAQPQSMGAGSRWSPKCGSRMKSRTLGTDLGHWAI